MFRYAQKQLKTLISCNQKVRDLGTTVITSVVRRQCISGIQAAPKSFVKVFMWNVAKLPLLLTPLAHIPVGNVVQSSKVGESYP